MRRFLVITLAYFTLFACATEGVELYNTVRAYNKLLVEAYLKREPGIVRYFATRAEGKRISAFILMLQVQGRVKEMKPVKVDFVEWKLYKGGKDALVVTKEEWKSRYLNVETLYPLTEYWIERATKKYHLKYEENRWKVDWVETLPY